MRLLRLLLTGLIAVIALVSGVIAALVLLVAAFSRTLREKRRMRRTPVQSGAAPSVHKTSAMPSGEVIDVEATRIPADPIQR